MGTEGGVMRGVVGGGNASLFVIYEWVHAWGYTPQHLGTSWLYRHKT